MSDCKTCGGTGMVGRTIPGQREFGGDGSVYDEYPCPDCNEQPCPNCVDIIKQLEAENDYLKLEIIDLRFLTGSCLDKISVESQIREKTDLAATLEYELQALKDKVNEK